MSDAATLEKRPMHNAAAASASGAIIISRVATARDTATKDCDAAQIVEQIRADTHLREDITQIRNEFWRVMDSTNNDRKAAKNAVGDHKKKLPGVTWSGRFKRRNQDALLQYSGLICADLDELGRDRVGELQFKLRNSVHLWAMFVSPTGDGLKCVFRVQAEAKEHKASFRAVEQHVRELTDVQIDQACSDVSRLCFLSYDPEAYLNEGAIEMPLLVEAEDVRRSGTANSASSHSIKARAEIADEFLGDIGWVSETRGYGICPGAPLHTTPDADRDLRVDLDGTPTIFCLHNSCKDAIDEMNSDFRSRIREAEHADVIAHTYFIEDKYWRRSGDIWRPAIKQNFADDLRVIGVNPRPSFSGDSANDVLRLMSRIRAERVLDAALPIVHDAREILELNGRQVLNVSRIRAMQPAEADDPSLSAWLHEFFERIWDPGEPQQKDYFLAWFQRFYASALLGSPKSGQAIVIAGEPGIGKTFLSWRIVGRALGGFSDGARFLKGETSFNKEIAEVPLLAIDDSDIADDMAARNKFTSTVKKFVADPQITYHPKGVDEITIPCKNRIIITCNQDSHSLGVLPRLDTSISDKLMFFKLGSWRPNYSLPGGPEQYVASILPLWLRWLLNWEPPTYALSNNPRFGIKPYKHPLLVGAVEEESPQATLKQMINVWFKESQTTASVWMSARDLLAKLSFNDANRNSLAKELGGPRLGRTLSSLGKDYVLDKRTNPSTNAGEYLITSPTICPKVKICACTVDVF
jgi:hypothetical protein